MEKVFPAFNAEEAFVADGLTDEECRTLAGLLRKIVVQTREKGEERRVELLDGAEPAPRRSGRRAKELPDGCPVSMDPVPVSDDLRSIRFWSQVMWLGDV